MTNELTEPAALSPLKRAFLAMEEAQARLAAVEGAAREPIAVVGVGCRLPGADGPAAFWNLLKEGRDAVGPIPIERFDIDRFYDADTEVPGRIAVREAAFLASVDGFDAGFFGISPREARGMDPQQRLLLEVAWEALEHAGQAPDRLSTSATGVFVGQASSDYATLLQRSGDASLLDAHFTSGVAHSCTSGRVSYLLGLQGPSITVDTACSSSLVAVHLACQSLRAGECRMALAGGVNLMLSEDLFIAFSHSRMLAPDGRCKTFDASADGFGRGEGCGVVVLKRLTDAQADGDRIIAVIRGSAVNQDGPSSGLTAPNGPAQEAVIRTALARAGVTPGDIGYVEAHGTGTQLGDPLEVQALGNVFGPGRDPAHPLWIGSVKTNLGHLEAAAGVTGLIKLVLSLQQRAIPAHLHLRKPSPHIAWSELPMRVPTELQRWEPIVGRRLAGVSSFGFSGTNVHVVLEEAPAQAAAQDAQAPVPHLYTLSARDPAALRALARRHADALGAASAVSLADACFTANAGRAQFAHRAAITASSLVELRERLVALADGLDSPGLRTSHVQRRDPPRIAFLFTGQGSQYAGMARGLYDAAPLFRATIDRCADLLAPRLGRPLLDVLFEAAGQPSTLDETAYTQPALFAIEYALAELWRSWGVTPDVVMGHSVGEYAAACVAGAIGLEDAIALVAERGRLMQSLPPGGAMVAIVAPEAEVAAAIAPDAAHVSIAAVNGAAQTVIAGEASRVKEHAEHFAARGIPCRSLAVSHAFHSPLVEPVLEAFERVAAKVRFAPPRVRLISNLTGRIAEAADIAQARYWRRHMREAVRFGDGLQALSALKPDIVVEIGPHPTLLAFAQSALDPAPLLVPSLRKGRDDREQLLDSLSQVYIAGGEIDWPVFGHSRSPRVIDLPTYPFQRERHWFQARAGTGAPSGRATGHPLLGTRLRSAVAGAIFESHLGADSPAFVRQHRVLDRVVLPATAYLEILAAAAHELFGGADAWIENVVVREAMLLDDDGASRIVQAVTDAPRDGGVAVIVSSQAADAGDDETWQEHASAVLRVGAAVDASEPTLAALRARCAEPITPTEFYAGFERRGLSFGAAFHTLRQVWRGDGEALGEVELPDGLRGEASSYRIHPVLLDGCLQAVAAALPPDADDEMLYLPIGIGRYVPRGTAGDRCWSHVSLRPGGESMYADVRVFDIDGGLLAELHDVHLKRVTRDALRRLGRRDLDDCMYETQWPMLPLPAAPPATASPGWSPEALVQAASGALDGLCERAGIAAYDAFLPRLESLCADYTVRTMQRLGWEPVAGERIESSALADRLRVVPGHRRLFARLLAILAEDGWLANEGGAWHVRRVWGEVRPIEAHARLRAQFPDRAELELTGRVAAEMAETLRGEREPMQLLFPGGVLDTAERLYRDASTAILFNGLMAEVMAAAAAMAPSGRPLRILEIGAGTGGTTAHVLPRLPAQGIEYTFTDVGPLFVARAKERFGGKHAGMRFEVLDLEREPEAQGFAQRRFDLVIASNVIHATADLRRTLARVRRLLGPGGLLAMLEVTAPQRWFDLTVGITEGWWAFTDTDLRPDYATMPRERWITLLAGCGFEATAALPERGDLPGCLGLQSLLLARASAAAPARDWLVFADRGGTMAAVVKRLRDRGDRCAVVHAAAQAGGDGETFHVRPSEADDYRAVLAALRAAGRVPNGVVHGWSLDIPASDGTGAPDRADPLGRGVLSALRLAQAIVAEPVSPRLWLVTRGAQPVAPADRQLAPDQAPLVGLGKAIALEHPELGCTCVDLAPGACAGEIEAFAAELSAPVGEALVGLRESGRHVARLSAVRRPAAQRADAPWRLQPARPGVLDAFERVAHERVPPGPGQVEIEVEASGLNFKDVLNALGMYPGEPGPLGGECAGRVSAVGPGVTRLRVGDAVLALAGGSLASHVIAREAFVQPQPPGAGAAEAASFGIAYVTAEFCLGHLAGLRRGERVLVHAAAGGVGMAAVRLALRAGAEVFATAGTPWKRAMIEAMGVRHVLDSRSPAFADEVLALTAGRGVDVVLNSLAGEMLEASLRSVATGGRFVEIGKRGIRTPAQVDALGRGLRYFVVDWGETGARDPSLIGDLFARLVGEWRDGRLAPLPRHEFALEEADRAFRFMAQARHAGRIVLRHGPAAAPAIRRVGSYLVTGGLSGLGLEAARWLAAQGAGRLVLVGRRGITPEAGPVIEAIRAGGTIVDAIALDIADEAAVRALLARLRAEGPPLRGVIHSAGALADAALLQQDDARFAQVFAAKVEGARLLDSLTRGDPLDFLVFFSSVAAVLGSAGQANHCAANSYLDVLAHERRSRGLPALSINWGPWSEVGAAADRGLVERLAAQGLGALTPAQGLAGMERLMADGARQGTVLQANWPRFLALRRGAGTFFSGLGDSPGPGVTVTTPPALSRIEPLRDRVESAPAGRQRGIVAGFLHERACRALGIDVSRTIDPRRPLGELGLDSLLAVELRNTLGKALGRPLPATLLFDYPNLEALTDYLCGEVLGLSAAAVEPAPASVPTAGALVDSIEDLSDEEVDRLLAQRNARVP